MSKVWATSDLHFHHRNICNYTNRHFVTAPELHDQWVIDLWNSTVQPGDIVYHLGDFCFNSRYEILRDIVRKLNGQKHFIIGNHDKEENFKKLKTEGLIHWYGHYKEIKIKDTKVVLSHFPFASWHRQHYGSWHLHGHTHGCQMGEGKILDAGLDMSFKLYNEHKFFDEQMIEDFMNSREITVVDGHKARGGE
jgi:calcineurin-like phosphoesterase family protein